MSCARVRHMNILAFFVCVIFQPSFFFVLAVLTGFVPRASFAAVVVVGIAPW